MRQVRLRHGTRLRNGRRSPLLLAELLALFRLRHAQPAQTARRGRRRLRSRTAQRPSPLPLEPHAMIDPKSESPRDKQYLQEAAELVRNKMPEGYGFIVFAFPFNAGGRIFYASNANRADAINAPLLGQVQAHVHI